MIAQQVTQHYITSPEFYRRKVQNLLKNKGLCFSQQHSLEQKLFSLNQRVVGSSPTGGTCYIKDLRRVLVV